MMRVLAAWPHAVHRPRPELAALVHLVAEQETGARRCQPAAGLERLVTVRPGCVTTPPSPPRAGSRSPGEGRSAILARVNLRARERVD
jgi:hypothetical protein